MSDRSAVREGIVIVAHRDGRFLLIRRAAHIFAGGAWCFVGGGIDPHESHEQAAEREFREEVGGAIRALEKVWEYTRPDGLLRLHWWLVELLNDELIANPAEVAEIRWCTPAEIDDLPDVLASNIAFLNEVGRQLLLRRA